MVTAASQVLRQDFLAVDFFAVDFLAGDFFAVEEAFFAGALFFAVEVVFLAVEEAFFAGDDFLAVEVVFLAVEEAFFAGALFFAEEVDFFAVEPDFFAVVDAFLAGADFFADELVFFAVEDAFLAEPPAALRAAAVPRLTAPPEAESAAANVSLGSFLAPDTTSLSCAPGLKLGTAFFLAFMRAPVEGLRTHLASRTFFSKEPNPVMATFSPLATSRVMVSSTDSSA